jgi:hypothetical protein
MGRRRITSFKKQKYEQKYSDPLFLSSFGTGAGPFEKIALF